jgi:hypothetical protein
MPDRSQKITFAEMRDMSLCRSLMKTERQLVKHVENPPQV